LSWFTKIALRNRSLVGLAVVAAVLFGVYSITSLKQELIPDLTVPYLTVVTVSPGSSPSDVERSVTTPLEQVVKTSQGVKTFASYSNEGLSIITVEYEFGTDMDAMEAQIQEAVSSVRAQLPATALPPEVAALNFDSLPVLQLAVTSDLPSTQVAAALGQTVVPELQGIDGVQAVTLSGVEQTQLQIQLDAAEMAARGVSPTQIVTAVQQANLTSSAGTVTSGSIVYPVTVAAGATTVKALERLVLPAATPSAGGTGAAGTTAVPAGIATATAPGTPITLGDVADVRVGVAPVTAITRTNGEPSIGISISKSATGNTVDIATAVADKLPELNKSLNAGLTGGEGAAEESAATISTVVDQSTYIEESITSLWQEGLLGAVFAVLVIWVFLRSWRSTLVASLSIPLSVIGALIILFSRGESLNMLTLGGLTIAIGRVIDDSIVVIENVYRHLQEGDDVRTAAFTGTREVAGAITASTLTTVAVFLPLGFVQGLASEFFRPFALTVTFALLASLAVALIVVPVATTWVMSKKHVGHREPGETTRLQRAYLPILKLTLDHKALTLIIAASVFGGTMMLTPLLKTNLFDSSAQNTMSVILRMPAGTSLDATMRAAGDVEDVLAATEGVDIYQVTGGSTGSLFGAGGGTSASSSQAVFAITTDPDMDKNAIIDAVRAGVAEVTTAESITVTGEDSSSGMSGMSNIEVLVSASDPAVLLEANEQVLQEMAAIEGLANVSSNLSEGRPAASIVIDQAKATAAGVSPATLTQYTTLILEGYPLGTVPTADGPLPAQLMVGEITVPPIPGAVTAMLTRLPVPGAGGLVPLSEVAKVSEVKTPVQVTHIDGARTASITASVVDNNIGAASTRVTDALTEMELPEGATWDLAGATEMTDQVFRSLGIAMLVAILLVYLIMVVTFRSLLNPLILLVSIPFAAVGAVLLLVVTGTSLGMPSMVGLLMLIGIVVTNAIVLLDLVEQFRRQGMDAYTAVIEGGRRRLRPILMTAIATILALLPMSLGLGKGGFLSTPLAVVVIGGLFTSTLLTLVLVPVLYCAFDRWRRDPATEPDLDAAVQATREIRQAQA
jgi:HAE1 family hydrophobic/amphiphilic exporter-1